MNIGILSLQGCVEPHVRHIRKLGATAVRIRSIEELRSVSGLILPGGESTTMLKLLRLSGLDKAITQFSTTKPVWGICAGSILVASKVIHPEQDSLGLIEIVAERNHYGCQLESFEAKLNIDGIGDDIAACFIRAPLLSPLNSTIKILAKHEGNTVCMRQGHILVSSFHTELGDDSRIHEYFIRMCIGRAEPTSLAA